MRISVQQINYLNIALMVVSAVSALWFPFETFLIVYAFLGPLHYLTEISWLHDRQYFTKRKYDYLSLMACGVLLTMLNFDLIPNAPPGMAPFLTYIAFVAALVFARVRKPLARVGWLVLAAVLVLLFKDTSTYENIFGVFLPTLIHVFIFTALFILVGALKGRDLSGILSLVVFVLITCLFIYLRVDHSHYVAGEYVRNAYGHLYIDEGKPRFTDGFIGLNNTFMEIFKLHNFKAREGSDAMTFVADFNNYLYGNPVALAVMSFIAFAYMYHYLNWFSKTSVIQWHNIPRSRFIGVIALWLGSIGLYAYDYRIGLKWLFFLSFTHVLLEFPLNHITFVNIGKEIRGIVSTGSFAKPAAKSPAKAAASR